MIQVAPPSAPECGRREGTARWLLESLGPLWNPAWLLAWSVTTIVASAALHDDELGQGRLLQAVLMTTEAAAWGAMLVAGIHPLLRSVVRRNATFSPGAYLPLAGAVRTAALVFLFHRAGLAPKTPAYVWFAALSSLMFLVPIYCLRLNPEWRWRFIQVIAVQAAPLAIRVLFLATPLIRNIGESLLMRSFWLPDVVSSALLLMGAHRMAREYADDPIHRAGIVLFAIHSIVFAVLVVLVPTWLL